MAYGRTTTTEISSDAIGNVAHDLLVVAHPFASFSELYRAILDQLEQVVKSATFCGQAYIRRGAG
jgi:hypothetical protein